MKLVSICHRLCGLLSLLLISMIALVSCNGESTAKQRPADEEVFVEVASDMLRGMSEVTEQQVSASLQEEVAAAEARLMRLASVHDAAGDMQPIITDFTYGVRGAMELVQSSDPIGAASTIGGNWLVARMFNNEPMSDAAMHQAAEAIGDAIDTLEELDNYHKQINAARLRLLNFAPQNAGPDFSSPIEFVFHEPGPTGMDTIRAVNMADGPLHEVVLSVRLIGRDGASYKHAHYIPKWQPGERREAAYSSGLARTYARETVRGVRSVVVDIYAREGKVIGMQIDRPQEGWPEP